jgi:hypothetical protein
MRVIIVVTTTEKRILRNLAHWAVQSRPNNDGPMPFFLRVVLSSLRGSTAPCPCRRRREGLKVSARPDQVDEWPRVRVVLS